MKFLTFIILSLQLLSIPSVAATMVYVKESNSLGQWKEKQDGRTVVRMIDSGETVLLENSQIAFEVKKGSYLAGVSQGSFVMIKMQKAAVARQVPNLEWVDSQIQYLFEDGTALVRTNRGNFYVNIIADRANLSFVVPREQNVTQVYALRERVDHGWDAGNKVVISRLYDNGIAGIIGAGFFVKSRIKIAAVDIMVPVSILCKNTCD